MLPEVITTAHSQCSGMVNSAWSISFVPAEHAQAEDRAYRYGQKSNVLVYYPLFQNTIEGAIYDILNRKKEIIRTVMGDGIVENTGDIVEEILNLINNRR